jgi:hypothetical protein
VPTLLPPRQEPPPPDDDRGIRDVIVAAVVLIGVAGLLCEKFLGPTAGYSLSLVQGGLQLSP